MVSGRQTLGSIERTLSELRREEASVKRTVELAMSDIADLRRAELDAFRELARFRLRDAGEHAFGQRIDKDEAEARKRLEQRDLAQSSLRAEHDALTSEITELTEARRKLTRDRDAASDRLDAILDEVDTRLEANPEYAGQRIRAEEARKTADAAREKAKLAATDRAEKGRAYERDPLFLYLWQRGFGTPAYRHGGLVRLLDRWVAGLIRYQDARPNYAMLVEIPERLDGYASDREAEAAAEQARLGEFSRKVAAEIAGTDLAGIIETAETGIEETTARLEKLETELEDVTRREQPFLAGEDADYRSAEDALLRSLRSEELSQLWKEALATPSREDEQIVRRLQDLEARIDQATGTLESEQRSLRDLERRRDELVKVTRQFRRKGYDTWDSTFNDDSLTGVLLGELAKGALSGADYWAKAEKSRRKRSRHGRDIGFPGGIGLPGSMGGERGGGSFGGGGFSGGGSFGGGGFDTGDSF
ncbi:coiled-coil domain-containing protein [Stappia sp. ICDLI1TA098]|jgi:chromosome segregation ATPase